MFYFLLAMPGGEGAGALPNSSADTSNARSALFVLPWPPPLDIHDSNAAEKWKEFELKLGRIYSIAMKLHQEPEAVQVATLLSVVGAEVRKVFAMFTDWVSDTYQNKIQPVLQKFAVYYQPLNVPFERYKFYSRMQESGESYDHYQTTLRQLVERCEFESITPNQILRDKLVFGIFHDSKVREKLLHEKNLSLEETDEICRSHMTMLQQMRVVGDAGLSVADAGNVNAESLY